MLNEIKAVIFDLDGTLIDSMWLWKHIDIEYLGRYGIPFPENLQREIEGMSFSETAVYFKQRFELPDDLETIKKDWNAMAADYYMTKVTLKKKAYHFLEYLKKNQIKTGIGTSNSKELVGMIIERFELSRHFNSIRTSCEVAKGKPAPDIYLKVTQDLGVEPREVLVFEDVPMGIMAAKNAGMKVCAVYDEFSEACQDEIRGLADYYINSFEEVLGQIEDFDDVIFAN